MPRISYPDSRHPPSVGKQVNSEISNGARVDTGQALLAGFVKSSRGNCSKRTETLSEVSAMKMGRVPTLLTQLVGHRNSFLVLSGSGDPRLMLS